MEDREYILWISLLKSISVKNFYELYEHFDSMATLYHCSQEELSRCNLLNLGQIQNIVSSKFDGSLEKHLEMLQQKKIKYLTINDNSYPFILKNIYLPPPVLYYYGNIEEVSFESSIAIVGSRNASYYGLKMSEKIAFELASLGITVVSGMARGVDSMAHVGALKGGGKTVAVLGNGIDIIYPKENSKLYKEIMENGLVLSEYPPEVQPMPYNFPRRNRIISGLSMGIVVVEATAKSGSLITAKYALEQGREVYALPGNVNNKNSAGTNLLIKDGAKLITSCKDILVDVFPMFSSKKEEPEPFDEMNLSKEEKEIIKYIKMGYWDADKLCHKLNLPINQIQTTLTTLEIKGRIAIYKGNYYIK